MKLFRRIPLALPLLILLELVIFFTNYQPGTFLIGWDNVMPELNFKLNFQRSFFSLWQEYRGLGLLDGMSHSANLFHTVYTYILSLILPQDLIRYAFLHLTHLAGGIGMYFLGDMLFRNKKVALITSLFYLLNLGVIQMYFAPLEVFAMHFAALPLLALLLHKTLTKPSKRNLFFLFLASLLTSPQGFVPTVFIAFLLLLGFFLFFHILQTRKLKTAILVSAAVFFGNAFWLLPYGYSALKTPATIQNTRINEYASEEIYYRNKAHGTLTDVLSLKGFMMSTIEYDHEKAADVFFMESWREYQETFWYRLGSSLFLLIGGLGIVLLVKKKQREYYPYLGAFAVSLFFLANNTPVLEQANTLIRVLAPVVGEAFRFPFTKFVTLFAFCLSLFIGLGTAWILSRFSKQAMFTLLLVGIIIGLSFPAFTGNFTSPLLRLTIPQAYFDVMSYLQTVPSERRIAVLPAHTFWNWHYRTWGHRGSGFLWYGVKQPMLERSFDPWSLKNEQYYNELSHALHNQDHTLFANVLKKYDIGEVLVDEYVINTLSSQPINYNSLLNFLNTDPLLSLQRKFGRLSLYEVKTPQSFVSTVNKDSLANVNSASFTREDYAFSKGSYVTTTNNQFTADYLLPSLFTEKLPSDNAFNVTQTAKEIIFSPKNQSLTIENNDSLTVPSMFSSEFLIPVSVKVSGNRLTLTPLYPRIFLNDTEITLPITPVEIPFALQNPTKLTLVDSNHTLDLSSPEAKGYLLRDTENFLIIKNGSSQETVVVDTSILPKEPFNVPLPPQTVSQISIVTDKILSPFSSDAVLEKRAYELLQNTEHMHPFSGKESFAKAIRLGEAVTLSAKSANQELVFYQDNLYHQASYILFVNTDYKEGLPLNFYIDNPFERRAELEAVLSKTEKKQAIIIPRTQPFFQGYGFHFTVKSIGTEVAETTINNITLFPLPQTTIEQIAVVDTDSTPPLQAEEVATPIKVSHPGYYLTSNLDQTGTVLLSQAYDEGWRAYELPATSQQSTIKSFFVQTFPFVFGKRLDNHVLVNGWQNGWALPNDASGNTLVFVYLPLYLQLIGFLMVVLFPLSLLVHSLWKRKRD